jgi:hypothetical protein
MIFKEIANMESVGVICHYFQKIAWDHKENQKDINDTIELIRLYEQSI